MSARVRVCACAGIDWPVRLLSTMAKKQGLVSKRLGVSDGVGAGVSKDAHCLQPAGRNEQPETSKRNLAICPTASIGCMMWVVVVDGKLKNGIMASISLLTLISFPS